MFLVTLIWKDKDGFEQAELVPSNERDAMTAALRCEEIYNLNYPDIEFRWLSVHPYKFFPIKEI